ncbi:hypothetical protein LIER_22223 [Lithospermum erythrorhizon]|uniref:RNase H type-1 domain-containing protein n=1 Tax=Lithospermum erythrorhizon TaxID=34254 RepID=A0AAV3QW27_LITER
MKPPNSYKDVQKLIGCLAALNRSISKSGERNLPFFKNLRRMSRENFLWEEERDMAFQGLKKYLGSPQLLWSPESGETLQIYLVISDVAYALRFSFPTTNNEAEYEATIVWLRLVKSLEFKEVLVKGDSKLVIDQIQGACGVKSEILKKIPGQRDIHSPEF